MIGEEPRKFWVRYTFDLLLEPIGQTFSAALAVKRLSKLPLRGKGRHGKDLSVVHKILAFRGEVRQDTFHW